MKVNLIFRCLRCNTTLLEQIPDNLNRSGEVQGNVGAFVPFDLNYSIVMDKIHHCTATQRGTVWFVGYDIIEDGHSGDEPSLGGG